MSILPKNLRNNFLIIGVFVCILMVRECQHSRDVEGLIGEIANYKTEVTTYKNGYGQVVSRNKSLVFENKRMLKEYLMANDTIREALKGFKSVNHFIKVKEYITITDSIPYLMKIPFEFKPFTIRRDSIHFTFVGTIAPSYFKIDSLRIPNEQSIAIGEIKKGLFRKEFSVEITNSNPLITTTNIGSYTFKEKKKWYQRGIVQFGAGVLVGYGLGQVNFGSQNPY